MHSINTSNSFGSTITAPGGAGALNLSSLTGKGLASSTGASFGTGPNHISYGLGSATLTPHSLNAAGAGADTFGNVATNSSATTTPGYAYSNAGSLNFGPGSSSIGTSAISA